jgi:hypothetical protein
MTNVRGSSINGGTKMRNNKMLKLFSSLMILVTLVITTGCATISETSGVITTNAGIENNRWLELLNVLPANEYTYNAAFLRDDACKLKMANKYPQLESPLDPYNTAYVIPLFGKSQMLTAIKRGNQNWVL